MLRTVVVVFLDVLAAYIVLGVIFAMVFHRKALTTIDPATRQSSLAFRLLITPGIIALWPLLAARWRRGSTPPGWLGEAEKPLTSRRLRATHALLWKTLAVVGPLILAAALLYRPAPTPIQHVPVSLPPGTDR